MDIDIEWVRQQLTKARVLRDPGNVVLALLEVWELSNLSQENAKAAVEVFSKLALGHALVPDEAAGLTGRWEPAYRGNLTVRDVVRVRSDAFTGPAGVVHNGRVGRIVGIRSGDIIINTIDNGPPLEGVHLPPEALEKHVK